MALKDIIPQFSEADIANDGKRPQPKVGTYLFQVTAVGQKINEKGNMLLSLKLAPLDAQGNPQKPGASLTLVGPFQTPPEALAEAGVPFQINKGVKGQAPNTLFIIEDYARVRKSEKNPFDMPATQRVEKINGKYVEVSWDSGVPTGNPGVSKAEADAANEALHRAARTFYQKAWANPDMLVGDRFYGQVTYEEGGDFDGAQVGVSRRDVPQDPAYITDLVDMTQPFTELR